VWIERFKKNGLILPLALTTFLINSCATSPTGIPQLSLISDAKVNEMGRSAYNEMRKQTPSSKNKSQVRYVKCIVNAITKTIDTDYQWQTTVFADDQVNAFALPGGKMGIYSGMFKVAKNQHQVAAVMAHEVGHVLANHGKARLSSGIATQAVVIGAALALGSSQSKAEQLQLAALGVGLQVSDYSNKKIEQCHEPSYANLRASSIERSNSSVWLIRLSNHGVF